MKNSKNIFLAAALLLAFILRAQSPIDFNHYQPLQCAGIIPEDFRTLSQEKYNQDVKNETKSSGHYVDQDKQDFLLKTDYLIDELLLSGKVLFGDTATTYVNRVADHVLMKQPDLRAQLRFYCLKSDEANAFSTNQGIIFVTLGLLAQLENEAQLAFVISHEVAHYEKKHAINSYLENEKIFSDRSYKYNTYDDRIRLASTYSKDLELEADQLGLERLQGTGYDCDEAIGALFVLQFAELPFEDYAFDPSFLQTKFMKFPTDLVLDSVKAIDLNADEDDDTYSTHPNIATRRKALESLLSGLTDCGSLKFIEAEQNFMTVRKVARFETVRIELNRRKYCTALYNSYVLQRDDSDSYYLKLCIGKALYGMAKYKNHDEYSDISEPYGSMEGNQQRVFFLFQRLSAEQLNLIALRYLYNLSLTDTTYLVTAMRNDLTEEAVQLNNIHLDDMKKTFAIEQDVEKQKADTIKPPAVVEQKTETPTASGNAYVSKYDKLRQEKKKQDQDKVVETKKSEASKFDMLAFADIQDDPGVIAMFSNAEKDAEARSSAEKAEKDRFDHLSSYEQRKELQKQKQTLPSNLGIDTVVYVDPFYYQADDRKGVSLVNSENQLLEFTGQIRENALYSGLSVSLLAPKTFGPNDVDKYNDLATINDWMGERLDHKDFDMIPIETDRMIPVAQKYHTTHFCYTGVFSYKERRDNAFGIIVFSILCWPLLPAGIVYACTPVHHTYYYTLMYNVESGKTDIDETITLRSKSKNGYINSIMYDTMVRIRGKKKDPKGGKR